MMTLHTLFAGSGYTYLTESVATGDRTRRPGQSLANYYAAEEGTPPGEWVGAGAERLKVEGLVTESHMLALFGEGRHPLADEIISQAISEGDSATRALKKSQIGRLFAQNIKDADPMLTQIDQALRMSRAKNDGKLSADQHRAITLEIGQRHFKKRFPEENEPSDKKILSWVSAVKSAQGEAVAGFDLVFTPQKSVTALWGIADENIQKGIEQAHREAVSETLAWMERNVSFSRKGAGGVIRVEGDGLTIARFDHFDNRAGDPNLHTHCAVANKIFCPDDGKWRSLDGRAMFQMNVAASNLYNQTITNKLRNQGLSFHAVSHGENKSPVYEISGVPESLMREFSRRDDIERRLEELMADYRDKNKREPSKSTQIKLAQQATLETRGQKQSQQSLINMRDQWKKRAENVLGTSDISSLIGSLVQDQREVTETLDVATSADRTLELLERRRSQWNITNIYSAATESVASMHFETTAQQNAMIEAVMEEVRDRRSIRLTGQRFENVSGLTRTQGKSLFHQSMTDKFTSPEVIFREQQLLDATRMVTPFVATRSHIDATISRVESSNGFPLNAGQRAMAHWLLGSGAQLSVAVGPAGAGKTTSMKVVSDAWRAMGHNVIGLGPSAAAANVLGSDLGIGGQTIASILTREKHGLATGITEGTLIIVDEAGMASTRDLYELNEIAQRHGALVRMIGDPAQLSAVESGGMLEVLAQETSAPSLEEVVRFKTQGEAEASLKIRQGEHSSYDFYADHGRISTGSSAALRDGILSEWIAETNDGKTSLMLATTRKDVALLNDAAQKRRLNDGSLTALSKQMQSRDGATLHSGDHIVTRKNDSTINMVGGEADGRRIFNGDLWTVSSADETGNLHVIHKETGGRAVLPAEYVKNNVELGYASTVHRAQGMTVDTAHLLISGHESRELAYVGLSRGKTSNKAWIVTEQSVDPESEHDKKVPANAQAVWEQVMNRASDNKAALSMIEESTEEDKVIELETYNHVRESLIREWSINLAEVYSPEGSEQISDDRINDLAQAVGIALNAGVDVESVFASCTKDNFIQAVTDDLSRVETLTPVGVLPPQAPGVDGNLLDWARTARTSLLDDRRLNADRLVAVGDGLTPHRAAELSERVLSEQKNILLARREARRGAVTHLDRIYSSLTNGDPHRHLQESHQDALHQDSLITTVKNLHKSSENSYGSRRAALNREISALRKQLPSEDKWLMVEQQALQARRDIAEAIQAERSLAQKIQERLQAARFDEKSLDTALSVIDDELVRRAELSHEDRLIEQGSWGRGDTGLFVATTTQSVKERQEAVDQAKKSIPTTVDITRMLLDSPDMSEAPDSIAARVHLALNDVERSTVERARHMPDNKEKEINKLIEQRRELEAQLTTVLSASVDPVASDSTVRDDIRQVQAAEPSMLNDISVLDRQVQAAQKYAASLPPVPKAMFVATKKKQEAAAAHRNAAKQVQEIQRELAQAQERHCRLLARVPDRSTWDSLLAGDANTSQSRERVAEIRLNITDIDNQISAARTSLSGHDRGHTQPLRPVQKYQREQHTDREYGN